MADNDTAAPAPGQGAPAAPQQTGTTAPFFSFTGPDGKAETFATREDLDRAWKDSYFRRSDYIRKTQELGNLRKQHEQERKEFEEQLKALQKEKERYERYNQGLLRRPDVARQLESLAAGGLSSPQDLRQSLMDQVQELLNPIKSEIDTWKKEREAEKLDRGLQEAYRKIAEEFPDFDQKAVEDLLYELSNGDSHEPLVRLAHFAARGMLSPAQAEQRAAQARERKAAGGMPPSGSAPKAKGNGAYRTVDEALEAAMKDMAK